MASDASLLRIALAEAPHPVGQEDVLALVREIFRDADYDVDELASVFANSGVERRTLSLPLPAYAEPLGPERRNATFLEVSHDLLTNVARRAVPEELASSITHVVTVSSTGVATPSLECAVMEELELPTSARRVPLFGLGCAGGVAGLSVARDLARSDPEALVLLLCVELTSLTYLRDDLSRRNFVASAIFGDGAAGALVGGSAFGPGAVRLGAGATRLFPGTSELMGWNVRDHGWEVVFSPRIPAMVRRNVADLVALVARREDVAHFALHPGGRKVLDAYEEALELTREELAPATEVLASHGNMSSVTVLFVLDRLARAPGLVPGPGFASAFGPGFTAEMLAFELAEALP